MASGLTARDLRRTRNILRWVTGLSFAVAAAGAWFGLKEIATTPPDELDLLYREWQLIRTDWQPDDGFTGPLPWQLSAARFVLPLAATAFVALLTLDIATLWRSLTRNHTIVVGKGIAASTMADELRESGQHVLQTEQGDKDSLRENGIRRARALVVCGEDDNDAATNLATTGVAVPLARRPGFTTHMLIGDPGLALALRARRLVQPDDEQRRVRVFNVDELAARHHVRGQPLPAEGRPHVLVVGAGTFGRAVIVEFASRWASERDRAIRPLVTLVASDADRALDEIADRWPNVARTCELRAVTKPLEVAMMEITERPYRSYFSDSNEVLALRNALTAATRWRPDQGSVVVRTCRLTARSDAFGTLFDNLGGALVNVSVYDAAAREVTIAEDPLEALARAIHQTYVDDALSRGEQLGSGYLVPWASLPEDGREANLAQARDLPAKLAVIRCSVAPRSRLAEPFFFRPGEVEKLARDQHEDWVRERSEAGWKFAPKRDYSRRTHPLLRPWDELPASDRARNRAIVRDVPLEFDRVLEREGLQIVRLATRPDAVPVLLVPRVELTTDQIEKLAVAIHEDYLAFRVADGVPMGSSAAMRPWDQLPETIQQANLAQAGDIGLKLDLLEATVDGTPPATAFELTDDEVEALARYEQERWVTERAAAGWTYSVERDDAARRHPRMVPWLYLSEKDQDLDRRMVRNLPALLATIGLYLHR